MTNTDKIVDALDRGKIKVIGAIVYDAQDQVLMGNLAFQEVRAELNKGRSPHTTLAGGCWRLLRVGEDLSRLEKSG
jgi:hypothetical protein